MGKEFKIYTRTGDDGTTGLVGGSRVKKYDIRLEAYGTIDELNSYLGVVRSFEMENTSKELILWIQEKLFTVGAKLASDEKGKQKTYPLVCSAEDIGKLEQAIDLFENNLPELKSFILPGGTQLTGFCHIARTVCRRAERRVIELSEHEDIPVNIIKFINRLSDFLFVLSRKTAFDSGIEETPWIS